jgi:hypothetical protein
MFKYFSNPQPHARYCPAKNTKVALFLVASFSLIVFLCWRNLHASPNHDLLPPIFGIFVAALILGTLSCLPEKLIILAAIASLLVSLIRDRFPSAFGQHIETANYIKLTLWLLALLLSITLLIQSLRTKNPAT